MRRSGERQLPCLSDCLMRQFKLFAALVLILLGLMMIYLGLRAGILPPSITGIGFFVIAAVFIAESRT